MSGRVRVRDGSRVRETTRDAANDAGGFEGQVAEVEGDWDEMVFL